MTPKNPDTPSLESSARRVRAQWPPGNLMGMVRCEVPPDPGSRIIKVDHAGEHGAVCIYTGQILLARLTARDLVPTLVEFREHERRHRAIFQAELTRRAKARCRSYHLCALGGFFLGVVTGLFGRQAIIATTVAVESVVLRHLEHQIAQLDQVDAPAVAAIRAIHADEQLHHDLYESRLDPGGIWVALLKPVVTFATETVIWLGMRV